MVKPVTGVDVGPLFGEEKVERDGENRLWDHWDQSLLGFKSSFYKVKTTLIVGEVIIGYFHDTSSIFHWGQGKLNLPRTKEYSPVLPWISKRRKDEQIACEVLTFMDNK